MKMQDFSFETLKEYGPYATVVLLITLPWFFQPGYLFFTDLVWGPALEVNWWRNSFVLNAIVDTFSVVVPVELSQKIYFSLALFVVLMGGKKIAALFTEDRLLVFALSLFALFNPFVYDRIGYGQIGIVAALGFLMLAVGCLLELPQKNMSHLFWVGLWAGLAMQLSPHFIFLFLIFAIPILAHRLWVVDAKEKKRLAIYSAGMLGVLLLLNANWIVGIILGVGSTGRLLSSGIQHQDLVAFQTSGESGFDALKNVFMLSGFWGKDQFRYLDLQTAEVSWGRSFLLLLPIIFWGAIAGLRSQKRKWITRTLIAVFAVAALLAVGIRLPIARELTYWLFDHMPMYTGMRETQKWAGVLVIVYLLFLSLGARKLFQMDSLKPHKTISALFLSGVMVMQAPLLIWGMAGQFRAAPYPTDWQEVNDYIVTEDECAHKILFLPWHLYMGFKWEGHIVGNPAGRFFECDMESGSNMEWGGIYDNIDMEQSHTVRDWIISEGEGTESFLQELNVRYVILAKDADWFTYEWLENAEGLKKIIETRTLMVFEIMESEQYE